MSQEERFGTRDLSYSIWHRARSIGRFVGEERAATLGMIDLDGVMFLEYEDGSREPLALIELAMDTGQREKVAVVMKRLAQRCSPQLPAFVVLYRLSDKPNPASPQHRDIAMFRVRRLCPEPETGWMLFTPQTWAAKLLSLRAHCEEVADGRS
jgi:hypothetical protein